MKKFNLDQVRDQVRKMAGIAQLAVIVYDVLTYILKKLETFDGHSETGRNGRSGGSTDEDATN